MVYGPANWMQNKGALASRLLLLLIGLSAIVALLYTFTNAASTSPIRPSLRAFGLPDNSERPDDDDGPATETTDGECRQYADAGSIAYSIKTGATVAMERLPIQLMTALRCVPDPMVFSDLEQTLGNINIIDVLDRFSPEVMQGNADFDLYHKQKEYAAAGREDELHKLGELPIREDDWRTAGHSAAWGLDKYKFLHMVERAWEIQPARDWYVFVEADTYLSIPTLQRWLATLNPREKLYLGNAIRMWEHPTELYFAHGGSGIVMSGAAVKDLAVTHAGTAHRFDGRIKNWWYGDFILADALDEVCHIKATDASPSLQGDEPAMIPFGEHLWCKKALTLHHMGPRDFDQMYQFEKSRGFPGLLFRDVYNATYKESFPFQTRDWDNGSDDARFSLPVVRLEKDKVAGVFSPEAMEDPHKSLSACEQACIKNEKCFQFALVNGPVNKGNNKWENEQKCHLSRMFKKGEKQKSNAGKEVSSGWRSDRIERWVRENQQCPDVP